MRIHALIAAATLLASASAQAAILDVLLQRGDQRQVGQVQQQPHPGHAFRCRQISSQYRERRRYGLYDRPSANWRTDGKLGEKSRPAMYRHIYLVRRPEEKFRSQSG